MNDEYKTTILQLMKLSLGITHDLLNSFFDVTINGAYQEINSKLRQDNKLDLSVYSDLALVVDYATWMYKKRHENIGMSRNLQYRIYNRVISNKKQEGEKIAEFETNGQ